MKLKDFRPSGASDNSPALPAPGSVITIGNASWKTPEVLTQTL